MWFVNMVMAMIDICINAWRHNATDNTPRLNIKSQESFLPGQRKKEVDKILRDDLPQEGPGNTFSSLPLTESENGRHSILNAK